MGRLAKTDPLDASLIAHFAEVVRPPLRPLPDLAAQELTDLLLRRRQLLEMKTAESNRGPTMIGKAKASIEQLLNILEQQLCEIDEALTKAIEGSAPWKAKPDLLQSIPGIGPVVSRT